MPQINNKNTRKLCIQANLFMNTKGMFAETFQHIPEKTNIMKSSYDGLWEICQLKNLHYICNIFLLCSSLTNTRGCCAAAGATLPASSCSFP